MSPELSPDQPFKNPGFKSLTTAFMIIPDKGISVLFDPKEHLLTNSGEEFSSRTCQPCPLKESCQQNYSKGEISIKVDPSVFIAQALCHK